ncbi:MAG: hypothetical protein M3268_04800, partial [Acidobacteriota bacterium]|nr:hypothetical protein [Acidobacteriota bacterium]
ALRNEPDANAAGSAGGNANAAPKEKQQRVARDQKKKDEDKALDSAATKSASAETRSVAGRRFRREGDAWIDTAYHGEATTVVRRGSEQYRALVADEPQIARITNALGGEVVVVWKGRAYRIKP